MRKTLSVSSVHLYQKIALLLLTAVASIPSLYFLLDTEWYFLLIGVVLVIVLLRSSYLAVLDARKIKAKQFQTLVLEDEHFVFKNAPKGGGEQVSVAVHYDNIKSVGIQGASLYVLLVRRQNWKGLGQDYFAPVGVAPKLQLFALPSSSSERALLFHYLQTQGFRIERKIKR